MPITLTVTGHEEIITSLNNLSDKLKGPEVVTELARMSAEVLKSVTPVGMRGNAGLLQRTMSEVAGPEPTADGWWAGVGNLEGIYPLEPAPRDTIKNFLEMIRGQKGGKGTPPPSPKKGTPLAAGSSDYDKQYAKATAWQERNRSKTEAAFWLLFKEGEKSTGASKAELNRARRLLDIDRAIRRKYHGGK